MGIGKDGYYSLREILGYNCKYNIILSDRGRGKSYGTKLFLMEQEGTAMCLYRTVPDMSSAMKDWLEPLIEQGYSPETFQWDGNDKEGWELYRDGVRKIWFRAVTMVNHIKQEKFPDDMNWVWLDEFIPLVYKKLPGVTSEGDAIRTVVKTIEHDTVRSREAKGLKPVRVIMCANPFTWNNPVLSYFKLDPSKGYGVHKAGPGVAYEILEPMELKQCGKMTVEQFLGDEVNKNQGWQDQDAFVMSLPKGAIPDMSIRIGTRFYTAYIHGRKRWIVEKSNHTDIVMQKAGRSVMMHYGTLDGLMEDEICIDRLSIGKRLKDEAYEGKQRYDNINTKFDWLNSLNEF
jgi:hypothetical protein